MQRRSFGIVFVVLGVLGISFLAEFFTLRQYANNWEHVTAATSEQQVSAVRTAFAAVQRKVRRIAAELARHPDVYNFLAGKSVDATAVFAHAATISRNQDVGVEVYDRDATLVAWHGRSDIVKPDDVKNALQGILTSYITRGPLYSQLFVLSPVRDAGEIVGAILVRQAVEVNYPLSNKFITRAGVAEQLSRALGVDVEIVYGENAEPRKDGRYASATLNGIDGRKLGVASFMRTVRSSFLENVSATFQRFNALLYLILVGLLSFIAHSRISMVQSWLRKCLAITMLIWLARYALLWLDIPFTLFSSEIFTPTVFAARFGAGLVKSLGELALTSGALFLNTMVVVRYVQAAKSSGALHVVNLPLVVRILLAIAATAFLFLLLRGYAAVIRSAVFDSSLRFNDATVIIPSFELALMMLSLFIISCCLIIVAVGITRLIVSMFGKDDTRSLSWLIVAALFAVASVLFEYVQDTPLVTTMFRMAFGAAIILFSVRVERQRRQRRAVVTFANSMVVLAFSAIFFYPLLNEFIHEKDRDRIGVFAREVLRPADTWLQLLVNESLQQFSSEETVEVLLQREDDVEQLSFICWAKSKIAQEGYNSTFLILDAQGIEVSRFAIGEQSIEMQTALNRPKIADSAIVGVRDIGSGLNTVKIYSGSTPIVSSGQLLGHGVVVVSAAQQSLFRGETPTVFRAVSQENLETFYQRVTVTEFANGALMRSNNSEIPIGYRLPNEVASAFNDSQTNSVWRDESVGGTRYETLYIRRAPATDEVVALSVKRIDLLWHLFGVVRTLVYFSFVVLIGAGIQLLILWAKGTPYAFTFRDKLLAALVVTAAVPVLVIGLYSRTFARERLIENLSERLKQEISAIEESYIQQTPRDSSGHNFRMKPSAEQVATRMEADFNLYIGNKLSMSSRTELYNTGILDRRLSGSAYASLFGRGERFHLETESIGLYQYAVGYKPLVGDDGRTRGAISVPTLYRQEAIDEEVARTNAVLFGVSAVILLAIALIATTFANRIAAPIHKLTEATKRVALGDLDVKVNARSDGEIGELIHSFEAMTRDLKRSRENLVQYERELAWKEMAKQVAHEIKNPLTPMKLALQHLRQTYKDRVENFDEIFEEVSQMVIRQVDALSRIASEFSSFARMPKARLERLSVNDVLREAAYLFERDALVKFDIRLEQHLPPIMADREELRRAFINIIRNGIQAMNNEGKMIVTTAKREQDIEVRVRDFGSGIPDEIKGKLFQPNFSTKTDGMGLGLAIVKKTVEDLNGSIDIESALGEGTTVIIHIPTNGQHETRAHS